MSNLVRHGLVFCLVQDSSWCVKLISLVLLSFSMWHRMSSMVLLPAIYRWLTNLSNSKPGKMDWLQYALESLNKNTSQGIHLDILLCVFWLPLYFTFPLELKLHAGKRAIFLSLFFQMALRLWWHSPLDSGRKVTSLSHMLLLTSSVSPESTGAHHVDRWEVIRSRWLSISPPPETRFCFD